MLPLHFLCFLFALVTGHFLAGTVCQCSIPVAGTTQATQQHHLVTWPRTRHMHDRISYEW